MRPGYMNSCKQKSADSSVIFCNLPDPPFSLPMKKLLTLTGLILVVTACNAPRAPNPNAPQPSAKRAAMAWTTVNAGEDSTGIPQTTIILSISGGAELYRTNCTGTASTQAQGLEETVAGIQCWYAGGGDQYAVFVGENEKATLRHRTVDEVAGFGTWENVKSL